MQIDFIPQSEFVRVKDVKLKTFDYLSLIAKMCRLNTLVEVKKAGSGHLGSSLSAMDIVVYLYYHYFNIKNLGIHDPNRDIYFSSKGHDVPGFYSILYSLGIIPEDRFLRLRHLGGLDGHPDINVPGIEANSGSLGMGISKARGMLKAKHMQGREGKVFVLTGDGEFQEGQNFEALQSTVQQHINGLVVMMDHNKLQSDRLVKRIVDLGSLENKISSFGWHVIRCEGHDFTAIDKTFKELEKVTDKPKFVIFDTIKGCGISFMEHPEALKQNNGFYKWHAGAPDDESFKKALNELKLSLRDDFRRLNLPELKFKLIEEEISTKVSMKSNAEFLIEAYGKSLINLAKTNKNFVLLDADLSLDCKIRDFEFAYPDRFFECGIAEQDMVSMASGMALQGMLPIVHSFANFLAARANEQIYNNITENKKIIYICNYAGMIPAGPGKSHQSVRDISLFGALPNCTILQASNTKEMDMIVRYAIGQSQESCMIRINIGPSPRVIPLPNDYTLAKGRGVAITDGQELVLMAYGPVMLHEALTAQEILAKEKVKLKIINMPWLNRFDQSWLESELAGSKHVFILEDHSPFGGLGDHLINFLISKNLLCKFNISIFGVEGIPACGTPPEALSFHGLDGISLVKRIQNILNKIYEN